MNTPETTPTAKARKHLAACELSRKHESRPIYYVYNHLLSRRARSQVVVGTGSEQPDTIPATASPQLAQEQASAPNPQSNTNDTEMVSFFHEFIPPTATAQSRRHNRNGATYPTEQARQASAILRAVCESHAPQGPLAGPLKVTLLWTWPGTEAPAWRMARPDLDNLAKLALDAMTKAGYWYDDAQVCEFTTAKFTGPIPGISVRVESLAGVEG